MRRSLLALAALSIASSASAAEPDGCDKFKWPVEADRAALSAPSRATVASGSALSIGEKAVVLTLQPLDAAALPMPPERKRETGGFAGFLKLDAPSAAKNYTLSLSSAVWVDVIQDGKFLKPTAFSGATGCDGIRKTMRFDLAAQPFLVQVSGAAEPLVAVLIRATD